MIGPHVNKLHISNIKLSKPKKYNARLSFPSTYGISSLQKEKVIKTLSLKKINNIKYLKAIELSSFTLKDKKIISIKRNHQYFIVEKEQANLKRTGNALFEVQIDKKGKINHFPSRHFYVKGLKGVLKDEFKIK